MWLQSFPSDGDKVKLLVLSNLYAYEVPPPPPIPTMSAEEEKGYYLPADDVNGSTQTPVIGNNCGAVKATQNNNTIGLNVIQRMHSGA